MTEAIFSKPDKIFSSILSFLLAVRSGVKKSATISIFLVLSCLFYDFMSIKNSNKRINLE